MGNRRASHVTQGQIEWLNRSGLLEVLVEHEIKGNRSGEIARMGEIVRTEEKA